MRKATLCRARHCDTVFPINEGLSLALTVWRTPHINGPRIFRFCSAPQKREGIDSLARLCQGQFAEDPFSRCVFVFRSCRGIAIRLLTYDGQGFWPLQKRLSKRSFPVVAGSKRRKETAGGI